MKKQGKIWAYIFVTVVMFMGMQRIDLDTQYPLIVNADIGAADTGAADTGAADTVFMNSQQDILRMVTPTLAGTKASTKKVGKVGTLGTTATATFISTNKLVAEATLTPTPTPTFIQTTGPTVEPTLTFVAIFLPVMLRQEVKTLQNGNFEEGATIWQESSSKAARLILKRDELQGVIPHSGEWAAWLGGLNGELSVLTQEVTVPPDRPFLQYWQTNASHPECGRDVATAIVNTVNIVEQFSLCTLTNSEWAPRIIALSSYAGTTITLQFRVDIALGSYPSSLYLDDIQWVQPASATQSTAYKPTDGTLGETLDEKPIENRQTSFGDARHTFPLFMGKEIAVDQMEMEEIRDAN